MSAWSILDTSIWTQCSRTKSSRWCGWRQYMHGPGGSDRQECWPGMGRSRLQHLLSTGLCRGSVLLSPAALSHSWGPDWTAVHKIKALKGTGCRGEGNSYPITYSRRMCFFLQTFKDVKRNVSAMHHGLLQSCFLSMSGFLITFLISCEPNTLLCADTCHNQTYIIFCAFQKENLCVITSDTRGMWNSHTCRLCPLISAAMLSLKNKT